MNTLLRIYHQIENAVLCILLSLLILLAFGQVAGRLFFNIGFPDADPVIYHLVMLIGLAGAVIAAREKEHITIDIVSKFVTGKLKHAIGVFTGIFSTSVCIILAWVSIRFVQDEIEFNESEIMGIPVWIIQLSIPISFSLMSGRFLMRLVENILLFFSSNPATETSNTPETQS